MLLFLAVIILGIKIARRSNSRFHALLVTGITSILAIQSVVNFAVVTGTIPPTGVPLPLVSAGGTSLVTFMFVIGMVVNVARNHSE
ncbi:MAG: FtsW/RodA/SpoVE family cell cycle protein [Clostridia bacterium]|nr:FtsW/RodA/SpoVE family cell cycle protein [Clostridia bacterium]